MASFFLILLILSILNKQYFQMIILLLYSFFKNKKKEEFIKKLISLKKINQIYISKEEKLAKIYGANNMEFQDYCLFLSSKSKNKFEKSFLLELKECDNKTDIDQLIDSYLLIRHFESKTIKTIYLLNSIICFFIFNFLSYWMKYFYFINFINIILLFLYILDNIGINYNFKELNFFDRFFCLFFRRMSYMTPMKSLSITNDQFLKKKNNPYKKIYEDIINKTIDKYNLSNEKEVIFASIYKVCYMNKNSNDQNLLNYYQKVNYKKLKNYEKLSLIIHYLSLIFLVIMEVVL